MFSFDEFIKTVHNQFSVKISEKELYELLDLNENYDKDNPNSTGKYLKIGRIKFTGEKEIDGVTEKIDYDRKLFGGVNVWIADNSKGKSSIFKTIKYALTGKNSLKKDIANWINKIYLEFKLGEICYTVFIDMSQRRKNGSLLKVSIDELLNKEKLDDLLIVFKFDSEKLLQQKMEEFFFHQMSFYPLKWTQKDSNKDSLGLVESKTSWRTYFKSIYLESKDYGTLFLNESYGNQEQKILEMILGLKLTYPINRLKVKRDLFENQMAQENISNKVDTDKQIEMLNNAKKQLSKVEFQILRIETEMKNQFNNDALFEKRSILSDKIMNESRKFDLLKEQKINLQDEINKTKRNINNLNEYIEFGSYYNGLDITVCPHCDGEIKHDKKIAEKKTHICMICNNVMNKSEDISAYEEKLEEQKKQLGSLEKSLITVEDVLKLSEQEFNKLSFEFEDIGDKIKINNDSKIYNQQHEKVNELRESKGALKKEIENLQTILDTSSSDNRKVKTQLKIDALNYAIELLENQRLSESKNIYDRFNELMLNQLSEFGLNSIDKIILDKSLNIKFIQNQETVTFNELNEGEKLRVKIAFFLSLIQLDIEYKVGRHPRFLIIDSPGKEEVIKRDLTGLSNIFKDIDNKYNDKLQIFVGTALSEFQYATTDSNKVEKKEMDEFIF